MSPLTDHNAPSRPQDGVLATLNEDGSRRWLRPKLAKGRFLPRRAVVAWALIALFTITPFIKIDGTPLFQFDVAHRRFTFFATTFNADETLLLALLVVSIFVGIFFVTALFGRAWCGWACPQTVYMEFVYRPLERFFDGKHYTSGGRTPMPNWRRALKYVAFTLISLHLANTFLAWFVGVDAMFEWTRQSPFEHPGPFVLVLVVTALMMLDFCFFREQMCTLACPYGRLQSVLLDKDSMIVGYDARRGEPRGKLKKGAQAEGRGDCVDCKLCVQVCPTGIDIRDGLQLECVGCTQCIDACDGVMDKIGKPRGLIRYSSENRLAGIAPKLLRPRVVLYPIVLVVMLSAFGFALAKRSPLEIELLRVRSTPYEVLEDSRVSSKVHVKLTNRDDAPRRYSLAVDGQGAELLAPAFPVTIEPADDFESTVFVLVDRERFERGRADVVFRVVDDLGRETLKRGYVMGPLFSSSSKAGDQ
ncbi:cytochrome c oxidase accessory protein CcoG [Engelhardtia mirabilis]|uniref:Electron transport protein YccM n=1 Tax=Engelhardtia mirabilis TaxID=2528011 RepID=A0A518BIJ4_9BACT|nr:Putative electron transport protein YccM [Planctomycetes bacterium Pla133]QDV01111.1 Putative electron transport protein YccM [Planctomycetes bacterium Pla86]